MASPIFELCDRYVTEHAALDPIGASFRGITGHDTELTDYSPEGQARRTDHARATRSALAELEPTGDDDRRARTLLAERLTTSIELDEAGEGLRALNNLSSPLQGIRQVFDLMPTADAGQWRTILTRMGAVPEALDGYRRALGEGRDRGLLAARRQVREATEQARAWAGAGEGTGFFSGLAGRAAEAGMPGDVVDHLRGAAADADRAYGVTAEFLTDDYLPHAPERDGVGPERYARFARAHLGADLDLDEVYEWGWDELHRIEAEMAVVADEIVPGATVAEAEAHLEADDDLAIEGEEHLRAWLQDLMDRTIAELDGAHFDIPEPLHRVEAMIAPPGGAAAMYYTGPSEDFSRPGRTWYPTLGKTRFPLWGEKSIAYHEGVPGHHLQVGQVRYRRERLSRHQRMAFIPGHGEGWALYAERLMDELGAYEGEPGFRLGLLRAQVMRAVRVVVDIGMHLDRTISTSDRFHPGERWTPELAHEFVLERSHFPADFMASEVVRYLGMPAQAISYKVGEREWLAARDEVQRRLGPSFDPKAFHAEALDMGPLGLADLRRELVDACSPDPNGQPTVSS